MLAEAFTGSSPVEVIVGPYRSGKTDRLLRELLTYCQANPFDQSIVIVPSARIRNLIEERLLALVREQLRAESEAHSAGYFGLRIMSFYQVCQMVLQAAGASFSVVPDNIRKSVLARAVSRMNSEGKLEALSSIAAFKGTHAAVLSLIDEFQRAALSPDQVLFKLEETAANDSRLMELARIYKAYWQELESLDCRDQHLLAFKVRELLSDKKVPALSLSWLLADGFDRFNRLQLQVLKALSEHCRRTTITFDFVDHSRPYYDVHQQDYLWKEISYQQLLSTLELEPSHEAVKHADPSELKRVIESFSTLDRFLEAEEIARRCKQLICEQSVGSRNILVVARDLGEYRAALEPAFADAGLPFFVDESVGILELPVVQYIKRLLELGGNEFSRADVVASLRSRYCKLDRLGLKAEDIELIDATSLKAGLVGSAERWEALDCGQTSIKNGIKKFIKLVRPPSELKCLTDFCLWLEDLLDALLERQGWLEGDADEKDPDAQQALAGVISAIRSLVEEEKILGPQLVSYDVFLGRLETAIDEANFRRRSKSREAITICGADFAPNRGYDHVFVMGMIEGEFPRRMSSSGFISAEELALWGRFGVELHNPRHHPGFEWALYRSLIDRARLGAHCSFPKYEMSGGDELVPSFFITGGDSTVERAIPYVAPYSRSITAPVSARNALAGRLWLGAVDQLPAQMMDQERIKEAWDEIESPVAVAVARSSSVREIVYNGYLSELVRTGALKITAPERWSASSLNDYGLCPFRYWTGRLLRMEKREEPESGLDVRLRGETYHKALELFFGALKAAGLKVRDVQDAQWQPILEQSLQDAFAWLQSLSKFFPGPYWHYEKQELSFRLKRFMTEEFVRLRKDQEPFEPAAFEVNFGTKKEGSYPPLVLEDGERKVVVSGVVDRVDVSGSGQQARIRVVDYKSGSTAIPARDAEAGRNLQVPLYALAVERAIMPGSKAVSGSYLSVASGQAIGQYSFEGEQHALMTLTEEHALNFARGVELGDFTVRPNGVKACKMCDHKKICRIAELRPEEGGDDDQSD